MATPHDADSRRTFLKAAVVTTAAAAGGFVDHALAGGGGRGNQVRMINVNGLGPAEHVVGGTLVELASDYLVFDALAYNRAGRPVGSGKAVVRLDGCLDWAFRTDGDAHLALHPVDLTKLDDLETYEVMNSTWVARVQASNPGATGLRHFIVTFAETDFECVATGLNARLIQSSFREIYEWLLSL